MLCWCGPTSPKQLSWAPLLFLLASHGLISSLGHYSGRADPVTLCSNRIKMQLTLHRNPARSLSTYLPLYKETLQLFHGCCTIYSSIVGAEHVKQANMTIAIGGYGQHWPPKSRVFAHHSAATETMKSTEAQTLGELRMRDTANWWAGLFVCVYSWSPASSSRRVWHGLATVVDSMRESIHAIRCDFLSPQGTQSERIRSR